MIKICFRGFYDNDFYKVNEFFCYLISKELIIIDKKNPDVIIYGDDITKNILPKNARILFTVENRPFNDWNFKYTMSFKDETTRNFFFSNIFYYPNFQNVITGKPTNYYLKLRNKIKKKNINFFYSNPNGKLRNQYLNFLIKNNFKVDSLGKFKNNIKINEDKNLLKEHNKLNIISNYKFTIAFENSYNKDYFSEKIWEPLSVNSIPIYYGGEKIFKIFNKKKIIYIKNKYDFLNSIKIIDKINSSNDLYNEYLKEDTFVNADVKQIYSFEVLSKRFLIFLNNVKLDKNPNSKFKQIKFFLYLYNKFKRKVFNSF